MISAVVLTHPNQLHLPTTLKSLAWADEIVVIYDGQEANVTLDKNIKVYIHPLQGDFAAQRNFGLAKATGDWIFFVDDDEVVSEALENEIRKHAQDDNKINGFYIKRDDYMWGKKLRFGETGNIKLLRLAKKNSGQWRQPVHEVWQVRGQTSTLDNPILHYPHNTVSLFLSSINTYSTLYAAHLFALGIKEPAWKIGVYPDAKFFVNYIWRLGFLDGTAGAVHALMMSFHSFLVRAKLWHLWQSQKT